MVVYLLGCSRTRNDISGSSKLYSGGFDAAVANCTEELLLEDADMLKFDPLQSRYQTYETKRM